MENHLGGKKSEANYADLEMMWTKANVYLKNIKALVNKQQKLTFAFGRPIHLLVSALKLFKV